MKHEKKFHKKYEKKSAERKATFKTSFASVSRHLIKLTCAWHSCLTQETMTAMMTGHLMGGGGGTFLSVDCQESSPPSPHSVISWIHPVVWRRAMPCAYRRGKKAKEGNP